MRQKRYSPPHNEGLIFLWQHKNCQAVLSQLYQYSCALIEETSDYIHNRNKDLVKTLPPEATLLYTQEILLLNTRLMHVVSWLLLGQAAFNGEMTSQQIVAEEQKISLTTPSHYSTHPQRAHLPQEFQRLIECSLQLEGRVRLLAQREIPSHAPNPINSQIEKIKQQMQGF